MPSWKLGWWYQNGLIKRGGDAQALLGERAFINIDNVIWANTQNWSKSLQDTCLTSLVKVKVDYSIMLMLAQ